MTLPSDPKNTNGGNADDPLGGLDPLAWLESLAKRQGANPDELTTSANIDVPMPPPDTVVDEPGYTPGYDAGKSAAPAASQPAKPVPPVAAQPPATPEPAPAMDASDPFGGLDPMAWMESLAKRQGANPDELTTAADLNVPLPPADTVIDEPGYTPGYDVRKPETPAAQPPAPTPKPTAPPVAQPSQPAAVQPAASLPAKPVAAAPEPAPAVDASDPFGGLDPMAWMESLAKRQGANPDELTTAADLNVPLPPADTVIDEPGYTPGYDVRKPETPAAPQPSAPAPQPVQPPIAAQPAIQAPTPEPAVVAPQEPSVVPEPAFDSADPFAASDPMAWLESLARRQGANPEELTTAANLNVPMPSPDAVIDEPGYTDYSPFAGPPASAEPIEPPSMSPAEAEALLGITSSPPEPNPLSEMDPLTWLESLAAPQAGSGTDFSMFSMPTPETSEAMEAASALSWLEQLAREAQSLAPAESNASPTVPAEIPPEEAAWADTTPRPAEEAGGMSDDLAEIQQWLAAQADSLSQVHELDETGVPDDEAAPAVPGELPDWLRDQMGAELTPAVASPKPSPLVDELAEPPIPADLPAWLLEGSGLSAEDSLSLGLLNNITSNEPLVETPAPEVQAEPDISPAELEALVTPGINEPSDPWIEAFEFEEGRKKAGDDSIPDWYMEALQQYGDTTGVGQLGASVAAPPDVLPPGDIPSWLSGLEPEAPAAYTPEPELASTVEEPVAVPGDIPAWLLGAMPDEITSSGTPTPGFGLDKLELAELPEWLRSAAEPEAASTPLSAAPEPIPAPVAPPVTPEPVQAALPIAPPVPASPPVMAAPPPVTPPPVPVPPIEHTQRLQQARRLVAQQQYKDSLPHYQALIDSEVHLDDVINDMQTVVAAQPTDPRSRRLLGDAHLRKGNLQAALDSYRSALDQL